MIQLNHSLKIVWGILLMPNVMNAQGPIIAEAKLQEVTVYRSGAELVHTADVALPAGASELVISNVAGAISQESIQVAAPAHVTIMSVIVAKDYLPADKTNPGYREKEAEIKRMEKEWKKVSNEKASISSTLNMLGKNEQLGGQQSGVAVAELTRMTEYYLSKQKELKNQLLDLDELEQEWQLKIQKAKQELGTIGGQGTSSGGQIVLQVMTSTAAAYQLRINYLSPNAGWATAYDLRADRINAPVRIVYKANLVQYTGINWDKVKLKVSTGMPSQGSVIPELQTWFMYYNNPYALNGRQYNAAPANEDIANLPVTDINQDVEGSTPGILVTNGGGQPGSAGGVQIKGMSSLDAGAIPLYVVDGTPYMGDITEINPADILYVATLKDATATFLYGSRGANGVILITTRNKGVSNFTRAIQNELNTTFDIEIPYTILSNGKNHSVSLKEYSREVNYKYVAVPKLDPDVFLVAALHNYEDLNLSPGEAGIIFENMYVGKTYINPFHTGDTLNMSMGKDRRIKVERKQVQEESSVKFMGSSKRETFEYEITVRNGKSETVNLLLKDQFPVATDKSIEVALLEPGGAVVDKETGNLSWNISLKPNTTQKVRFRYSVRYPKDKYISLR